MSVSTVQKIRAQQTCPLLAKETVLGPGKAEEPENGATVEGPVQTFYQKPTQHSMRAILLTLLQGERLQYPSIFHDEAAGAASREIRMPRLIGLIVLAALTASAPQAWALANPASVFCVQSGGKSEIRTGPRGQYGVCRLPNGRVVDEWSYFRRMKGKTGKR
jgi:putative hemolysin